MNIRCLLSQISFFLFLFFFLLMIVGCATEDEDIQSDNTKVFTSIETAIRSTNTPSAISSLQPTLTAIQPSLTPMPTAIVSPTLQSTPSLTGEEKNNILTELMLTNTGCELPCWWGIVPGESILETTMKGLAERGFRVGTNSAGIRVANDFGVFMEFDLEDNVIQSISVGGDYLTDMEESLAFSQTFAKGWQRYSLAEILNRYGHPTQVLVYSPFRADPGNGPSYHLLVFYESLGIEIEYRGSAEQLDGSRYRACPDLSEIWEIGLFLYQPDAMDNVVERVLPPESVSYIAEPDDVYDMISWQQATGTSLESFYETYSNPTAESCFEFSTQFP